MNSLKKNIIPNVASIKNSVMTIHVEKFCDSVTLKCKYSNIKLDEYYKALLSLKNVLNLNTENRLFTFWS